VYNDWFAMSDRPGGEMPMIRHKLAGRRMFLGALVGGLVVAPRVQAAAEPDPWPALAAQIFPDRVLQDGTALLTIDAPYRAEDAAVVPVGLHTTLAADDPRQVRKITLVIDANPSPVAAAFTLEADAGIDSVSTRVRVDDYTNIHAVAELSDGKLYAVARYVKAAGGCSAPALKQTADDIPIGTLRFREFPMPDPGAAPGAAPSADLDRREAQVMVRHPNYSGMQMDQISRLYIPADFLEALRVWQGDQLLLTVEGGISISENPTFRFNFKPNDAKTFRVEVGDSDGRHFKGSFPARSTA
jgi:sulfur-oxidizing protein SoxY